MKVRWHFPLINPIQKFSLEHYLDHIVEEVEEFKEETDEDRKRKEAMDILHAAETFARKFFTDEKQFQKVRRQVISKNKVRGYYTK